MLFLNFDYSRQLMFGFYEIPASQGTSQGVRTQGDVIPPKMSYIPLFLVFSVCFGVLLVSSQ